MPGSLLQRRACETSCRNTPGFCSFPFPCTAVFPRAKQQEPLLTGLTPRNTNNSWGLCSAAAASGCSAGHQTFLFTKEYWIPSYLSSSFPAFSFFSCFLKPCSRNQGLFQEEMLLVGNWLQTTNNPSRATFAAQVSSLNPFMLGLQTSLQPWISLLPVTIPR